jgi:quercetin dioxygenase-like cupin family protein
MKVFDLNKLAKFSRNSGSLSTAQNRSIIKTDIFKTDNYNVVLICLEAGQEIPSRTEPYGVCFYVIDGKGKFSVDNEEVELERGEMIFVLANKARGIKSKEKLTLLGIQDPH